ncbi:MAG TPA: DUF4350 domain-containing protein [Gemmatimonadaceae bacterium]
MTDGDPHGGRWYLRPGIVLPIVGGLMVLIALFAPDAANGRAGNGQLTTFSSEPMGAQLYYELVERLGWTVERRTTSDLPTDTRTIQAELSPPEPMRAREVHALLQAVRRGAAALIVLPDGRTAWNDSLHLIAGAGGTYRPPEALGADTCRQASGVVVPLWPNDRAQLYSLRWTSPPPPDVVTFVQVDVAPFPSAVAEDRPAVVGFPYGRGRLAVASDPDFLRNDALRVCHLGLDVPAISVLEYLRGGGPTPRGRVSFDEFHQGFGSQPGTVAATGAFFAHTTGGHALLQLLAAGLVWLLSAAPRVIRPLDTRRVERRSPIEQVDALGRAYAQVGATRTATERLLRGVRRRVGLNAARGIATASDDGFLDWTERTSPALAADVARTRGALHRPVTHTEFAAVGAALADIEASLTKHLK